MTIEPSREPTAELYEQTNEPYERTVNANHIVSNIPAYVFCLTLPYRLMPCLIPLLFLLYLFPQ